MTSSNIGRVQRGLQSRRADLDRLDAQSVKHFRVSGRLQVIGDGESSVTIPFPVVFVKRPAFSFGSELADEQVGQLFGGFLPTANAMVATWQTEEKLTGVFNYTGATLAIVTVNNPRFLWVHWHMEGKAVQNPVSGLSSPDVLPR